MQQLYKTFKSNIYFVANDAMNDYCENVKILSRCTLWMGWTCQRIWRNARIQTQRLSAHHFYDDMWQTMKTSSYIEVKFIKQFSSEFQHYLSMSRRNELLLLHVEIKFVINWTFKTYQKLSSQWLSINEQYVKCGNYVLYKSRTSSETHY